MNVLIEAPFTLKKEQETEIMNQVKSMATYDERITNAKVFFKMDDGTKSDAVLAEIQLHVPGPGPVIFASNDNQQFMNAFNGALNKVKRQLIKVKEQRKSY